MNQHTQQILNRYESDILTLTIVCLNLHGILDVCRFTNLIELNLYGNKISEIINLPPSLEILICNHNELKSLDNLPQKIKKNNLFL